MGKDRGDYFDQAARRWRLTAYQRRVFSRWVHEDKAGMERGLNGQGADFSREELFNMAEEISRTVPKVDPRNERGGGR